MSTRVSTAAPNRRLAALTIATVLVLGTAGCSSHSPHHNDVLTAASATRGPASAASPKESTARGQQLVGTPLAQLQGPNGLKLTITAADRDPANLLTISGDLTNDSSETAVVPAELRGNELTVYRTGPSFAGATIADFAQHKRYYVLRDTDGSPLTTTGLSTLKAHEIFHVFMQFPAPPPSTTTVGFQLPLFDTANIKISG